MTAPATFAGATAQAKSRVGWDRETIIIAIQEWVATYGEPPRAADWNPSSAKWAGQTWRIERYRAGRADGTPWPALNSAKKPFGGSLNAAVRAAGFQPAKPGPKRRTDVDLAQAHRAMISPEGRAMLDAALAQAREAERRVASVEARLDRALDRAAALREERDAARRAARAEAVTAKSAKPKIVRERVVDEAAVARAERRAVAAEAKADSVVRSAREDLATAKMDAAEARTTAKRLAARLERAEATIGTLRGERRELKTDLDRAEDRVVALERMLEAARVKADRRPEVVIGESPDAATVREALAEAERATLAMADAELRAARAERELRETVAALKGEARKLTAAELAQLRSDGPSGPAVMAEALKALALARKTGNPIAMQDALRRIASAAVTWQERV